MTVTVTNHQGLEPFLAAASPDGHPGLRTVANAWTAAGGTLHVGQHAVRLLCRGKPGRTFTAATLYGDGRLEVSRVLILHHGVSEAAWRDWVDEHPELRAHGFADGAKFPVVRLAGLSELERGRLAVGLRDLVLRLQP